MFSSQFAIGRALPDEPSSDWIELWRRWKIEHVLHLGHMADLDAVQYVHSFFDGMDLVAIEVCGALLELRKVFDGPQASLGTVNLLVEQTAQADRIEPEPPLLGADIK